MKYHPEKKSEALSRIAEVGVAQTSQELNISAQTLYKWQRELTTGGKGNQPSPVQPEINSEEIRQMILNEDSLETANRRLESENTALRDENAVLRQTISKMKHAIAALL